MDRNQLSSFNPNTHFQSRPSDLGSIFGELVAGAAKFSARQQVFERILDKISKQDLLGKSYVEQYLRYKNRRNCRANTLKIAATSLVQFLSFFASNGNIVLEQLSRQDIEAFVESLQDRGLKPATVCIRLRNVYSFVRYLVIEYMGFDYGLLERKVSINESGRYPL